MKETISMETGSDQKKPNETVNRMIELAGKGYNCSQIMVLLALEREGRENSELIRAMSGLGDGVGFFKETCGILTGAACLLGWYGGKGNDSEKESQKLLPMLQDLGDWFQQEIGNHYQGTRCKEIVGDLVGTDKGKQICGKILLTTHIKVNEVLTSHGFISAGKSTS